jgi:PAS domain-containing protein
MTFPSSGTDPAPLAFADPAILSLLDLSSEGLFLADETGRVVYGNRAWQRWCDDGCKSGASLQALIEGLGTEERLQVQAALALGQTVGPVAVEPAGTLQLEPCAFAETSRGWLGRIVLDPGARADPGLVQRMAMTQDFGRLAVWERSLDGERAHWDEHMFRFYGLPPQAEAPDIETIRQLVHPEDRERVLQAWQSSIVSPGAYHLHYRLKPLTGGVRMVHSLWRVLADDEGRPERVIGVLVDDTEGFELGLQMRKLTAQFEMAVELGELIIWVHDLATDTMRFNPRAAALLRLDDSVAHPIPAVRERVHPDDRPALAEGVRRALEGEEAVDVMARYRNPQGEYRTLLTRRAAQRDGQGQPLALLGVALDRAPAHRAGPGAGTRAGGAGHARSRHRHLGARPGARPQPLGRPDVPPARPQPGRSPPGR